jgi:hypothetical protein
MFENERTIEARQLLVAQQEKEIKQGRIDAAAVILHVCMYVCACIS